MLNWAEIDTVFLDMDGTLLDLHFDNHFWHEHVPLRFAEMNGLELQAAKDDLYPRFKAHEGTMNWYCLDFWSRELELDIPELKQELRHLIRMHPGVPEFLEAVRQTGRRVVLVTNAHRGALSLKLEETGLDSWMDEVICSHDLGMPKEDPDFWDKLQTVEPFEKERTLLVDDSLAVLRSAANYGMGHLLAVYHPDSKGDRRDVAEFRAMEDFSVLHPPDGGDY